LSTIAPIYINVEHLIVPHPEDELQALIANVRLAEHSCLYCQSFNDERTNILWHWQQGPML